MEMVDTELKTHHMKFCAANLKGDGAVGPQNFHLKKKRISLRMTTLRFHSYTSPFEVGAKGTQFHMEGFQLRVNHLREFHQNLRCFFSLYFITSGSSRHWLK